MVIETVAELDAIEDFGVEDFEMERYKKLLILRSFEEFMMKNKTVSGYVIPGENGCIVTTEKKGIMITENQEEMWAEFFCLYW